MKTSRAKTLTVVTFIFLIVLVCSTQAVALGKIAAKKREQAASKKRAEPRPKKFGIYWCTVDGKNFTEILTDPKREINHARVSNDHKWITFTRYNNFVGGLATEDNANYIKTEIMLCRIDGSDLQTLVPPKRGCVNGNGHWMQDDKAILYVSTDTPNKMPQLFVIDIKTKKRTPVPLDSKYLPTDPHIIDDMIVFPARTRAMKKTAIYLMKKDGSGLKRITNVPNMAENDPKLSPDKSKVVVFRNVPGKSPYPILRTKQWHTIVVDLKTGREKDISPQGTIDGVAEWSSDSNLLVLWQLDMAARIKKVKSLPPTAPIPVPVASLFTVKPDGSERKRVPLPEGYYNMPAFFPGTGSGQDAKIIFSARTF